MAGSLLAQARKNFASLVRTGFAAVAKAACKHGLWLVAREKKEPSVSGRLKNLDFADKMSPLGNAVAEDCANYCVMMFSDFTRKVTMQNLFHDGGFSSMGMSLRAMNQYAKDMAPYEDENGKVIYG